MRCLAVFLKALQSDHVSFPTTTLLRLNGHLLHGVQAASNHVRIYQFLSEIIDL